MTPRYSVNWTHLQVVVGLRRMRDHLSVREAADAARVAPTAIHRAGKAMEQSAANVLALCRWLGIDPLELLVAADVSRGTTGETEEKNDAAS